MFGAFSTESPSRWRRFTFLSCAGLALLLGPRLAAQQPNSAGATLGINGDFGPSGPIDGSVAIGAPISLEIRGSLGSNHPFALAFGRVRVLGANTPFGRLDLDGNGCPVQVLVNGFDPADPLGAFAVLGPPASPRFAVTLPTIALEAMPGGLQALVADPAASAGLTLTAAVDFFPLGAIVTSVAPASGSSGGGDLVRISGRFDCDVPVVTFGAATATAVLSVARDEIQVFAPPAAFAGAVPLVVGQDKGSSSATFTYVTGNPVTVISETFATGTQRDVSFTPEMRPAHWNAPFAPGRLAGNPISGSPLATHLGTGTLGTRTQITVTPTPLAVPPSGLFGPFDDAFGFNLGPSVNPNGGAHIMHLYERADLGFVRDALELVEWGPTSNTVIASSYPQFTAWCGHTSVTAPMVGPTVGVGLQQSYRSNYDVANLQTPDPTNLNPSAPQFGGVRVIDGTTYATTSMFTAFVPFPVFDRTFDFRGSGAGAANLILEMDVAPGAQVANFNRYRATAVFPVRRLIGASRVSAAGGNAVSVYGGFDIYEQRFTFVGSRASSQSLFYDTGLATPIFLDLDLLPSPLSQPPGTELVFEVQGADSLSAPNVPATGTTPWLTYFSGNPIGGAFDSSALLGLPNQPQLSGHRYYRFRVTMRADHRTNAIQNYDRLDASVTF